MRQKSGRFPFIASRFGTAAPQVFAHRARPPASKSRAPDATLASDPRHRKLFTNHLDAGVFVLSSGAFCLRLMSRGGYRHTALIGTLPRLGAPTMVGSTRFTVQPWHRFACRSASSCKNEQRPYDRSKLLVFLRGSRLDFVNSWSRHSRCGRSSPSRPAANARRAAMLTPPNRDELPPPHSITSSARASSVGGTLRPSAFAVLRLITGSYLVGACTGRSAGFSPLRMRST